MCAGFFYSLLFGRQHLKFRKPKIMQIRTLDEISIPELSLLFNQAFADYFVKIEITPEILAEKIKAEDIQPEMSVGVFTDDKVQGFILHAVREINGEKVAYNAGTGVVPKFRGNKSAVKMYDFILPKLKEVGVQKVVLEVMEQNVAAIKSYLNCGFKKVVNLECFNGKVEVEGYNQAVEFKKTENKIILELSDFKNWQPSWQHDNLSLVQSSVYETFCGYINNTLVCFASLIPKTGRVAQFAVNPECRRQGIGSALFHDLSEMCPNGLSVINVDGDQKESLAFLKHIGLDHFLRQFKMELDL